MKPQSGQHRVPRAAWPIVLLVAIATIIFVTAAQFTGSLNSFVPVTLTAERAGLVMETGAKVKLRGVEVGRVAGIDGDTRPVSLRLELFPDQTRFIPANVGAEIKSTTAFGAKYVELTLPEKPSPQRITAGAVLMSRNVATEVNTVFQNLVEVLHQIDPAKLNSVLSALADGVRGQGERMGEATTAANQVLLAINPRMDTVARNWRSLRGFADTYSAAAPDIVSTMDAVTSTADTIVGHSKQLEALLLSTIGLGDTAVDFLAHNQSNLVQAINVLRPTADLLLKYNPEYTCTLVGAKWWLDHGGRDAVGGNGRTVIADGTVLFGSDPYRYPENLPVVAAKGGPDGKPGCGSLPDASKNWPVRQLITNTGFGTGTDFRPNPGIGFPGWANYFPVTRANPEPPSIRYPGPPAPGPDSYPGGPAYGAPQYGPDGAPLYQPPPGGPPAPPLTGPSAAPEQVAVPPTP